MTVFVTVTGAALEEHWQPKVFGEAARPLLESCRNAETNIWQHADTVLEPKQLTELLRTLDQTVSATKIENHRKIIRFDQNRLFVIFDGMRKRIVPRAWSLCVEQVSRAEGPSCDSLG